MHQIDYDRILSHQNACRAFATSTHFGFEVCHKMTMLESLNVIANFTKSKPKR